MLNSNRAAVWGLAACLAATASGRPADGSGPGATRTRDVVFGRKSGLALTMDVYRPGGKASGAALLWVSSGDWMSDSSTDRGEAFTEYLARGYTVFVVGHGSTPTFPVDEIVPDVHRAVRYVRNHAAELRVDPDRIAVAGVSSGGHLAAHVGAAGGKGPPFPAPDLSGLGRYDPVEMESSKVAAFVSFCGPTDLVNYAAEGESILEFRLPDDIRKKMKVERWTAPFAFRDYSRRAGSFTPVTDAAEVRRRLKALSPVSLVSPDSSPGLLVHGDRDTHVPVRQAEALAARLRAAGVPVRLVVREGVGHGVFEKGDEKLVADWLDARLHEQKSGAR